MPEPHHLTCSEVHPECDVFHPEGHGPDPLAIRLADAEALLRRASTAVIDTRFAADIDAFLAAGGPDA